jgi:hypothetical protein
MPDLCGQAVARPAHAALRPPVGSGVDRLAGRFRRAAGPLWLLRPARSGPRISEPRKAFCAGPCDREKHVLHQEAECTQVRCLVFWCFSMVFRYVGLPRV